MSDGMDKHIEIDERDIRLWFMKTDLEQAEDTFRVVDGILQARREEFHPKRKKRSDAGQPRLELKEPQRRAVGAPLQDADIDEDCR